MDTQNKYRRIVIKVGSNVLTRDDGRPDTTRISALVDQVARLHRAGTEVILVSSGAVASGRSILGQRAGKLDSVSARQLFSAVGQVKLTQPLLRPLQRIRHRLRAGAHHQGEPPTRRQYLNQRNCMETMLANGVLPIVNENDTISVTELMFTDNDELSGLVAAMMNAEALIILSNIDGIYDGSPADPRIAGHPPCETLEDLSQYHRPPYARRAAAAAWSPRAASRRVRRPKASRSSSPTAAADGILTDLVLAAKRCALTRFEPAPRAASGVKKWIASSEGFAKGILHHRPGRRRSCPAPARPPASSPWASQPSRGDFERDDLVRILSPDGAQLAVGRISCDSGTATATSDAKGLKPLVHCDYLYME